MRYVMTSLIAHFRATLAFFSKRDSAMSTYHPRDFAHWMRGENYFNLTDPKTRKAIRFEASRFIVRVEGQDSLDPFQRCAEIALSILETFEIVDIFATRFESIQAKPERRLRQARTDFAKSFMHPNLSNVFPQDEDTDYAVIAERTEQVDRELAPTGAKISNRVLVMRTNLTLGPSSREEIEGRWLEFKERGVNELYKTKPILPRAAQIFATQITLTPKKNVKRMEVETLKKLYESGMERANTMYDLIFRG
jgi:hypothetical protein